MSLSKPDEYDPIYLELNPRDIIPTLEHDGEAVRDSQIIQEYLEDAFLESLLCPPIKMAAHTVSIGFKPDEVEQIVEHFRLTNVNLVRSDIRTATRRRNHCSRCP